MAAIYDNPNEASVLTPSHFLKGRSMMSLPEESKIQSGHLPNWKLLNKMRDNFWARLKRDYLQNL